MFFIYISCRESTVRRVAEREKQLASRLYSVPVLSWKMLQMLRPVIAV
jgi:hypothetical protein